MFFASFAFSEEIEKDDIFLIDDAPFDVHKSKIEEIQKSDRIDIEALASRYLTEELC